MTKANKAYLKGLGYGLTSGVITTLGMMVGLNAGTGSRVAVLGGIFIIAIGDSMSDALGIHISEESSAQNKEERNHGEVWKATFFTLLFKFLFALIFVVPVLAFSLDFAVWFSVGLGLLIIGGFSYLFARKQGEKPMHVVLEHIAVAVLVIVLTHLVGDGVAYFLGTA